MYLHKKRTKLLLFSGIRKFCAIFVPTICILSQTKERKLVKVFSPGATGRTRTADPRITNALLYQLSHSGNTTLFTTALCLFLPLSLTPFFPQNRKRVQRYCFFLTYTNYFAIFFTKKCFLSQMCTTIHFFHHKKSVLFGQME